jgi:hypothetical protein
VSAVLSAGCAGQRQASGLQYPGLAAARSRSATSPAGASAADGTQQQPVRAAACEVSTYRAGSADAELGLDFRLERLVGQLGGIAAQHHQALHRSWVSRALSVDVQRRRIRTTALVTGTLGTLDSIGVLAQHSGDEGKQWRWINALVRLPTRFG